MFPRDTQSHCTQGQYVLWCALMKSELPWAAQPAAPHARPCNANLTAMAVIVSPNSTLRSSPVLRQPPNPPLQIRCLLIEPFPESALNEEAGKLLMEDYEAYAKHARLMTSVHAAHGKRCAFGWHILAVPKWVAVATTLPETVLPTTCVAHVSIPSARTSANAANAAVLPRGWAL